MKVEPDGQCLMNAVLPQFLTHKELFTADLLQKQIALHMLKHANLFYPYVQQDLLDSGESYESYCVNIFYSKVWGDDFMLSALGHMFNIAITLISPCFDSQMDLFHTKEVPDVVVVANGGDYITSRQPCTHFSGSHVKPGIPFKIPGSEMKNPNLRPVIFTGYQRGVDDSLKHYLQEEKDMCLLKLRAVCKDIENFDSRIVRLIKSSDDLLKKKEQIEHKLENLGVKTEEIKKAGYIKKRRYVEIEKKRQQEETVRAAETISKEMEGMDVLNLDPAKNPIEIDLDDDDLNQLITDDQLDNIPELNQPNPTVQLNQPSPTVQFGGSEILQETVMQVGGAVSQERVNKVLLETGMNPNLLKYLPANQNIQGPANQNIQVPANQNIQIPVNQNIQIPIEGIQQTFQQMPGNEQVTPETVTQTSQPVPQFEEFKPIAESIQVLGEQKSESEQLVLVQKLGVRVAPRSRTTIGPIPQNLQDTTKYKYCNRCPHKYTTRAELLRHQRENCLKPKREYYCPKCLKSYYSRTTVREHYYQVHLQQKLYRCRKCGKEFANKSRRSDHLKSCPNKEKEDVYEDIQRDEQLEQLFVKGILMTESGGTVEQQIILDEPQGEVPEESEPEGGEPKETEPKGGELKESDPKEDEPQVSELEGNNQGEKRKVDANMEELMKLAAEASKKTKLDT